MTSVAPGRRTITVGGKANSARQRSFDFSWVADGKATQEEIFAEAGKPLAASFLRGFNCCIFAFGQTGSGKTYTIHGERSRRRNEASEL